jgi:glucose/arabinose dehydrogenase
VRPGDRPSSIAGAFLPMRRLIVLLATLAVAACSSAPGSGASPAPTPALGDIGDALQGPAGFVATTYATGLANVAAFAFDEAGRLWVSTAGYGDDGTDAVYLVATPGSTPTKVIGGVHTPLGLLWLDGELYVASKGRVDAYANLSGSTFAAHRTVLVLPDGVGEVNGLVVSPDHRLVLGISAPCDACRPTSQYAAAVVSFRTDGTDLRVEASGIRAPTGLAYSSTGQLYVTMNQRDDLDDATPGDWLAIVERGQDWGFPDCYGQDDEACRDAPLPVAELDKHAAASGVALAEGGFGSIRGASAFVAEWATGRMIRVGLGDGASVEPFVTGLQNPVPVAIAPDGALLAGDWGTGTVYRIAAG